MQYMQIANAKRKPECAAGAMRLPAKPLDLNRLGKMPWAMARGTAF
jgi:hypothetical protein